MKKKYYNDAFIGNKDLIATFSKYGELLRLYYPSPDYMQYSDFYHIGIKINDSNIIYLHNDVNNRYNQYYEELLEKYTEMTAEDVKARETGGYWWSLIDSLNDTEKKERGSGI